MDRGLAGWTLDRVCVRVHRGGTRLYPPRLAPRVPGSWGGPHPAVHIWAGDSPRTEQVLWALGGCWEPQR